MGNVTAGATVSLDGYITGPDETGFEHLFGWFKRSYEYGPVRESARERSGSRCSVADQHGSAVLTSGRASGRVPKPTCEESTNGASSTDRGPAR